MRSKATPRKRDFRCTVCGAVSPAANVRKITQPGHEKSMWCYVCKDVTPHVQVGAGIWDGEAHSNATKRR